MKIAIQADIDALWELGWRKSEKADNTFEFAGCNHTIRHLSNCWAACGATHETAEDAVSRVADELRKEAGMMRSAASRRESTADQIGELVKLKELK